MDEKEGPKPAKIKINMLGSKGGGPLKNRGAQLLDGHRYHLRHYEDDLPG